MVNIKLMTLLFVVTLALAACNIDQTVFENEVIITDRAQDPSMSPMPGSFAQNSIQVTLSSPTPDATILYTLDGTSPVNLNDFSQKVAAFWQAFGNDTSCRQIYYDVYDTVYNDTSGQNAGSWESEIVLHVYYGRLTEAQVQSCVNTMTVFTDPQYDSLEYLMTAVDPAGVDACVEVFTVMNNTIISDVNKWMDEVAVKDDVVLSSCLTVFEGWNESVGADLQAMVYTEPITISQNATLIAVAYRNDHLPSNPVQGNFVLTGAVNQPPSVSVTSPSTGSEFVIGDSVSLVASATDSDGSVARVEFFVGSVKIGERTTSPWSVSWSPATAGAYSISVRATDNEGAQVTSSVVQVSVVSPPVENVAPTVALTSPQNAAVFQSDEPIQLRASASDSDGTIQRVEFYRGSQLIHTVTSGAQEYNQPALNPGDYSFKAIAYDNDGASTESNSVSVRVNSRPSIALVKPTGGSEYDEGQTVYVEASASDSDGAVQRVEFHMNGDIYGSKLSAPYTIQFTNLVPGTYELTAIALDNDGASRTSSPVTFSVTAPVVIPNQPPIVSLTNPSESSEFVVGDTVSLVASATDLDGSVVRVEFFANNVKIGEKTTAPWSVSWTPNSAATYSLNARAYDNEGAQAASSVVQVSVVSPPVENVAPTVALTSPQNGAVYNTTDSIQLTATASDSDGTIAKVEFLVNGVLRSTDVTAPYTGMLSGLSEGTYSLRVRATDNDGSSTTSSAVDVHLKEYVPPPVVEDTPPPTIRFITPTLSDILSRNAAALVNIEAVDHLGRPVRVDLYSIYTHFSSNKDTLIQIGTLNQGPYNFELPKLREGTYSFTAKATDSVGQSTDATVSITVRR